MLRFRLRSASYGGHVARNDEETAFEGHDSGRGVRRNIRAGDPGAFAEEPNAKVLAYGATLIKGETGCTSFEFGVVCANSKGHGFFLSRAVVRYF